MADSIITPAVVPWGGHLDALAAMFAEWSARNGFEPDDGDAESLLLHPDATTEQRHWLHAFAVIWNAEQERLDAITAADARVQMAESIDRRACFDRVDFSEN